MKIQGIDLLTAAAQAADFPAPGPPEVAFLGRSNVGKSSLLNRLVRRKALARTSRTPGKTRLLHWYRAAGPGGELWLVDLPGYGYAKVSKQERRHWQQLVDSYLAGRTSLHVAVLLQDLRRDISDDEELLIDWLEARKIPVLVALTKIDKLKPMRRAARVRALRAQLGLPAARVLPTSSEKGFGIAELWRSIEAHL